MLSGGQQRVEVGAGGRLKKIRNAPSEGFLQFCTEDHF